MSDRPSRDASLDAIRAAYEGYARDGRAADWDPANQGFRRLGTDRDQALLELLRSSLTDRGDDRLLDVGCGSGQLAILVGRSHPSVRVTGIDLLPERIAAARVRAPEATFLEGSADDLPFADATFDVAAAVTLFSSLPTPAMEMAVANEIGRVLRPGGWLLWYDMRVDNPRNPAVHGLDRERLSELFPGWLIVVRSITLLPPIARRLGRSTPAVYPLLHRLPLLRSHLVGRLRRIEG